MEGYQLGDGLPRAAEKLRRGQALTVVAVGSSSTEGVGASSRFAAYPAWFGRALAEHFPTSALTVINRGVGGQNAGEMLARFDRDVLALHPDLVLWQTGTIEAVNDLDPALFAQLLHDGVARLRAAGADVLLINQQHSPQLEAKHPSYRGYVEALRRVAAEDGVTLFDRYAAMRRWGAGSIGGAAALMSPDHLHMKDDSYRCFGQAAAAVVTCAAGRACPNGAP